MSRVLLDTHVWVWLFNGDRPIPPKAAASLENSDTVLISAISAYEIARKIKLGKWPEMSAERLEILFAHSKEARMEIIAPDVADMRRAGFLDWRHRDPWDRLIAAAALEQEAVLVSADPAFDAVPGLERLWS